MLAKTRRQLYGQSTYAPRGSAERRYSPAVCMATNLTAIDTILAEIEKALNARLYYLAIVTALTLPSICAALETPGGDTSGRDRELYVKWFDANLAKTFTFFTGLDFYRLRCGGVHQARFGHDKMQYDRAVFLLPNLKGGSVQFQDNACIGVPPNQIVAFSAEVFCRDIEAAVRSWFAANKSSKTVQENLEKLVQYRDSYPPAITGSYPLIA